MSGIRNIEWTQYGMTVINPIAIVVLLIMIILIMRVERKYIIIPFIITAMLIPPMQRIVIATVDFTILRILTIFAILRIILKKEYMYLKLNNIDKVLIAYMICNTIINTILWGTLGAFVNRLGTAMDIIGAYYVFRISLVDMESYKRLVKTLIVISIFIAVMMIIEQVTRRNLFSIFGGISFITAIREGRLRSQGPFSHPILTGLFGALMIALIWAWGNKRIGKLGFGNSRFLVFSGFLAAVVITVTSSSSTPIMAFGLVIIGIIFWRFRKYTQRLWLFFLVLLFVLDLFMQAPIWHLIARIDLVGGSTGYHRYRLIDQAIRRFPEWFLLGTKTTMYWGWGLQDVTNQYILEGIRGGVISLILFISIIVLCFRRLGNIIYMKVTSPELIAQKRIAWSLAVILFAHVFIFLAVSYFAQMTPIYYLHIAMISSLDYKIFKGQENELTESAKTVKTL